ncbi:IS481 family transposase [Micromonospora peucetia]|uniref:IS481 family transposase n=1 Tax=Micromonospora peucetia TaxID=47871 RepID=A0ABZ1EG86_9ACTN|nr:IS481 family transposase [Micromonospora peucetia]WSA32658.1 IS481 family transposase [Micromonospora peucetia]
MALVVLSVVEQRLDAVRAVLAGSDVTEVAANCGVHRSTVHRWVGRYLTEQLAGLADRSHRPHSCPGQVAETVEVAVAEMRREHPRWGSRRIRLEMLRKTGPWVVEDLAVPSERTIDRILQRQGLLRVRPRKRPKDSYRRWERPAPMQLWQMDIVGGVRLVNPATGVLREAKLVTAVDDHSRYCVIAKVVDRATGRAVCLALGEALTRFGVPEEIITDNGKQFTDRFNKYRPRTGEVLFDKICRHNGITHRLTAPTSPNQNGKVERFHGTVRPDFLDTAEAFTSLHEAQTAVDAYVRHYNTDRPHQALDASTPVTPAERFQPVPAPQRALVDLWLPPTLDPVPAPAGQAVTDTEPAQPVESPASPGGPVEFDRVVPASGNLMVCQRQFWMGTHRAGMVARIWADCDLIHVLIAGIRVKTIRSHLSVNDLAALTRQGAVPAGPSPLPPIEDGDAVEVERCVNRGGGVSLGQHIVLAAEILAGRRVGIRVEPTTLMFYDLDTRELLRTRTNPLRPEQVKRLRGARPAGPPPRPSVEPVRVQRRASNSGTIMVTGQKVALGRLHRHQTVTVTVSDTTLAIELTDGDTKVIRRTTTQPVRSIKGQRPRIATSFS